MLQAGRSIGLAASGVTGSLWLVFFFQSLWKSRDHCGQLRHRWHDARAGSDGGGGGMEGKTLLDVCSIHVFLRSCRSLHAGRSRSLPVGWGNEHFVPSLRSPDAGEAEAGNGLIAESRCGKQLHPLLHPQHPERFPHPLGKNQRLQQLGAAEALRFRIAVGEHLSELILLAEFHQKTGL